MKEQSTMSEPQPEDLCYYGADGRIFVYHTKTGPTDRLGDRPLRELHSPDPVVTFNWGYIGSGPNHVARAILIDTLGVEPAQYVYQAFTSDFASQFPEEFRLRQGAVLRWLRGIACELGRHDFPAVLPPIDPHDKAYRLRRIDPEAGHA
jgi:hypothetical protein